VGSRGLTALRFTLRTAAKDMHSGRYGGAVRNANHELARLVASLHDAEGRIAVPGFMELMPPVSARDAEDAAALPVDEAAFYAEVGAAPYGDTRFSVRERITLLPTIEVNGMWGGYIGAGSKTVLPCEAHAKLTIRLGPGIDPARAQALVRDHLVKIAAKGTTLSFEDSGTGTPAVSLRDGHPLLDAAETVIRRTRNRAPVRARAGGTIPITAVFKERLGLDTITFGFAMPDEDVHAPNEFFRLSSLEDGLRSWPLLLTELGKATPEALRAG
jgi:acetylornithine deacetylase/succinyl-diaminopimelate desuccinylase-like protein